jgi:hypothetical protein
MELDPFDMRIESLEVRIVAARETGHNLPLQEIILTMGYTDIWVRARENRQSDYRAVFADSLSGDSIQGAIKVVKNLLVSDVLEITAEANFARQYIGKQDEADVLFHRFRYDSKLDFITALITLEDAESGKWVSDPGFVFTHEDFWAAGLVPALAEQIDEIGNALGFDTDTPSRKLQVTAFRSVPVLELI